MNNQDVDKSFNRVSYKNNGAITPMIIAYIIIDHPNRDIEKRVSEIRAFEPEHVSTLRYGNSTTTEVLLNLPDTTASMFLNMPMDQACKTIQGIKHNTKRQDFYDLSSQTIYENNPGFAYDKEKLERAQKAVAGWNF